MHGLFFSHRPIYNTDMKYLSATIPNVTFFLLLLALMATILLPLGGCGIRPSELDPPPGREDVVFPRSYPDPATDPPPGAAPVREVP